MCKYCEKSKSIAEIDNDEGLNIAYYYNEIPALCIRIESESEVIERMWDIMFCPMCGRRLI